MKKTTLIVLASFLASVFIATSYSPALAADEARIRSLNSAALNIVYSDFGDRLNTVAIQLGGSITGIQDTIANSTAFSYHDLDLVTVPAWQEGGRKFNFCYLGMPDDKQFAFIVESYFNKNIFDSYLKIHMASGQVITFKNLKMRVEATSNGFQQFDDIKNSIHILDSSTCTILLILGIIVFWPLLIIWAIECV